MFANFIVYFLIPQVRLCPEAIFLEFCHYILHILRLRVGDIHDHRLHRGQPQWHGAGKVFDQYPEEAFHGADNGAVQHHRRFARVVFGHVFRAKTYRQIEIELYRPALPQAAEAVFQREFDLGAVESALARQILVLQIRAVER